MNFLDLIKKYDVPGPRYTSYPPLPYWENPPCQQDWIKHINETEDGVDLYIHIPFCKNICHYCGCNRVKLCNSNDLDKYINYLLKEWNIYKSSSEKIKINSIHLGGGTPSILSLDQLDKLLGTILDGVDKKKLRGSIEMDPRTTSEFQLIKLFEYGIKRVSFGIQDFDSNVQTKIGRIQPYSDVVKIVEKVREIGFQEINFDLIFGLPGQSVENVKKTFEKVVSLRPDTIAYYSFAFVPHFAENQNNINKSDLLIGTSKWNLLNTGRNVLFDSGYKEVGMDHYALSDSLLYKAFEKGKLQRNFMGYVNHSTETVLGLGLSSISSTEKSFTQNSKDFDEYYSFLNKDELAIIKGHVKTTEDIKVEKIIHNIMCKQKLSLREIDIKKIQPFIDDKLMIIDGDWVKILSEGKLFLRNICMQFDHRLESKNSKVKFSRTI